MSRRSRGCGPKSFPTIGFDPRTMIARTFDRAVESLRSLGCVKVNLLLRRGNEAVRGFYEALGWVEDPALSMGRLLKEA